MGANIQNLECLAHLYGVPLKKGCFSHLNNYYIALILRIFIDKIKFTRMSSQLFQQDVLFYQRFLKANGFYTKKLDGIWGSNTDAADKAFEAKGREIATALGTFDKTSENNIATLAPKVQALARKFLKLATTEGRDVRIISGTRTYAEQDALYKKGRYGSTEGIVTNAKGGQSNHNFGIAWDIGIFEGGKYITADKKYTALAGLVMPNLPELEWGGNWTSFKDNPHYQHKAISEKVADVRAAFELGQPYV